MDLNCHTHSQNNHTPFLKLLKILKEGVYSNTPPVSFINTNQVIYFLSKTEKGFQDGDF